MAVGTEGEAAGVVEPAAAARDELARRKGVRSRFLTGERVRVTVGRWDGRCATPEAGWFLTP